MDISKGTFLEIQTVIETFISFSCQGVIKGHAQGINVALEQVYKNQGYSNVGIFPPLVMKLAKSRCKIWDRSS